jgi:UDP-N-acetylglucosamine 2-epimerase (non-hydrolysing)
MDRVFFEQLKLPEAKYNLDVGSGSHGKQTGEMLMGVEEVLNKEMPDVVLVEGDTNTVLAGALAAAKLGIKVGHVEAGLRSYDRQMPEEVNRVLADHCSDFLFAPTEKSASILYHEGLPEEKVFVVGNTVVDAVFQNLDIAKSSKCDDLETLGLEKGKYMIVTVHRQENVDDEARFSGIIEGLSCVKETFGSPLVYPVHPRARRRMEEFGLKSKGVHLVEPLDYLAFLRLESNARLVLTDSGGVQEESCILKVPCVTLRDNTERPETVDVGANVLAGTNPDRIVDCVKLMLGRKNDWANPFGDGKSGARIIDVLRRRFD